MVLFDGEGRVTKYMTPEEILWDFAAVRAHWVGSRGAQRRQIDRGDNRVEVPRGARQE